jgi:hypothetical protein
MGDFRWLLVNAPGTPDVAINLKLAETPEQRTLVGRQGASAPLLALSTTDCRSDFETMKARVSCSTASRRRCRTAPECC